MEAIGSYIASIATTRKRVTTATWGCDRIKIVERGTSPAQYALRRLRKIGVFNMADETTKCPLLCGWVAKVHSGDAAHVICDHCGEFKVVRTLLAGLGKGEAKGLLPYLSAHTRQANQRGEVVTLHTGNWKDFALAHKSTPISMKLFNLLQLIGRNTNPGNSMLIKSDRDAPLLDAFDSVELTFLINTQVDLGYIEQVHGPEMARLKAKGWEQIQAATVNGVPGKCFVAMSFAEELKPVWEEGIEPAVRIDCKMDPVRMDLVEHNEKICDKMIAEIRTCQFLVADVTLQRPNVYHEGGFAMGLGRPVIWTCSEDDRKEVHFDTRQYNHIFWNDPKDLRTKLRDRIKATIPMTAVH
jgi:nucleoside 2-deoxyribosyltransferase